jgi:hypothetical protein
MDPELTGSPSSISSSVPARRTAFTGIAKRQLANIGVEVTVEVLGRPVFLRRLNIDRDWDQFVNFTGSSLDAYSRSFLLDSRGPVIK